MTPEYDTTAPITALYTYSSRTQLTSTSFCGVDNEDHIEMTPSFQYNYANYALQEPYIIALYRIPVYC